MQFDHCCRLAHSPEIRRAAFDERADVERKYPITVGTDACPVIAIVSPSETPCRAASVTKPDYRPHRSVPDGQASIVALMITIISVVLSVIVLVLLVFLVVAMVVLLVMLPAGMLFLVALPHPLVSDEVDALAAGAVLPTIPLPVLLMSRRNVEVDGRLFDVYGGGSNDDRLRLNNGDARKLADIDSPVDARLVDVDMGRDGRLSERDGRKNSCKKAG